MTDINSRAHGTGAARPPELGASVDTGKPKNEMSGATASKRRAPQVTVLSKPSPRITRIVTIVLAVLVIIGVTMWVFGVEGLIVLIAAALFSVIGVALFQRTMSHRAVRHEQEAVLSKERLARPKRIVQLRNQHPFSFGVMIASDAGNASKSTTAANLALAMRSCLKAVPVIIIEGRRDSAQGATMHGLDRETTRTIREFYQMIIDRKLHNENGSLNTELIFAALTATEGGIFYLQADLVTPKPDPFSHSTEPAKLIMETLMTTGAIILVDAGNSSTENVTLGMAECCHVAVFPTVPGKKSLEMWRDTVNNMMLHAPKNLTSDCVTVLSAVKSKRQLDNAMKQLNPLPGEGHFYTTIFDHHLNDDVASSDNEDELAAKVANLDLVLPKNRDVYEDIAEDLWEMFVQQNANT